MRISSFNVICLIVFIYFKAYTYVQGKQRWDRPSLKDLEGLKRWEQ